MDAFHRDLLLKIFYQLEKTNELLEIIAKNQVTAHKQEKEGK